MRHQSAGSDDGLEHTLLDHVAQHQAHFGHGHGARKRANYQALRVGDHLIEDISGFPNVAPAERGPAHGLDEIGDAMYLCQIQGHSRLEVVREAVVQLSTYT
jgi:hypothetical protein